MLRNLLRQNNPDMLPGFGWQTYDVELNPLLPWTCFERWWQCSSRPATDMSSLQTCLKQCSSWNDQTVKAQLISIDNKRIQTVVCGQCDLVTWHDSGSMRCHEYHGRTLGDTNLSCRLCDISCSWSSRVAVWWVRFMSWLKIVWSLTNLSRS